MKRLTAFLLVALIGWNVVLTILYLQVRETTTAANAQQQTTQDAAQQAPQSQPDAPAQQPAE